MFPRVRLAELGESLQELLIGAASARRAFFLETFLERKVSEFGLPNSYLHKNFLKERRVLVARGIFVLGGRGEC